MMAVLLLTAPVTAASLSQLQQEQQQLQQQLNETKSQYNQTTYALHGAAARIQALNDTLAADQERVAAINAQIAATDARIAATEAALARTRSHLAFETSLMTGQVRLMEERGAVGYLAVVLGATSFSNFITRLLVMAQLAQMAGTLVQQIQAAVAAEAREQAALEAQQHMLAGLEAEAQSAASQVATLLSQQQSVAQSLEWQQATEQANISAINQRLAQVTQEIQALLAQYDQGFLNLHQLFDALYPLVQPIAAQYGLSPYLVIAVITEESGGQAHIVSYTGAIGLMQIEPYTAYDFGITDPNELYDPVTNVQVGCHILSTLIGDYAGYGGEDLSMALAAYNAGYGNVDTSAAMFQNDPGVYPTPLSWLFDQSWGVGVEQYVANIEYLDNDYQAWGAP